MYVTAPKKFAALEINVKAIEFRNSEPGVSGKAILSNGPTSGAKKAIVLF